MSNFHSYPNDVFLTAQDAESLALMLAEPRHAARGGDAVEALIDVLSCATVVPHEQVADAIVAMGSTVEYEEVPLGVRRSLLLSYPIDADSASGRVSVLSPVGRALLGRRVGTIVEVKLPSGVVASLLIRSIVSQAVVDQFADAVA